MAPTVGRIVHFYDPKYIQGPHAAIVTYVHDEHLVNLAVFTASGNTEHRSSVPLIEEPNPDHHAGTIGFFCMWPPRAG